MTDGFDELDEEVVHGARSPLTGLSTAVGAGDALDDVSPTARLTGELPAYLLVQVSWFAAFGMQMVIFPYLLKNVLDVSPTLLGVAQMALSLPSVVFILVGGVVAERADGRRLMMLFHLLAMLPAAALAVALRIDALSYWLMLAYALGMGSIGAFMMPARDAILNQVMDRRTAGGSAMTLQQGVAFATLAQFAAQIVGLSLGGLAGIFGAWPLLSVQAFVVGLGAVAALFLHRCKSPVTTHAANRSVVRDIAEGMRTVIRDPVLLSMVGSMFGVGLFVIGAFLVVLPIINADVYHSGSVGLRNIFVTFWAGAFVSSVALSRVKIVSRPGRPLLIAQVLGSAAILILVGDAPYWAFLALVFFWGLAAGVSIMLSRSIVQSAAPPELLARVLSIYQLGFMGGAPLGAALMGVIAERAGPKLVILVPSLGMLAMLAAMLAFTPLWNLRHTPPGRE